MVGLNTELSKPYKKRLRETSERDCKYSYCDRFRKLGKGDRNLSICSVAGGTLN